MKKITGKNNMENLKNKTITIALILLMLTLVIPFFASSAAAAKTKTTAFLSVDPSVVGLKQTILVNSWVIPQPLMVPGTSVGEVRSGYYYNITKPNGDLVTVGPHNSDRYGSGTDWFAYTPDALGNWTVQFWWAGDDNFTAVESAKVTFLVQSEQTTERFVENPLPEGYWERPISVVNREWSVLGGSWLQSTGRDTPCFNPYSTAPAAAHVLWKIQTSNGGIIGGDFNATAYSSSAPSKIIINGLAYYSGTDGVHCVDVHTGQEQWVPAKTMGSGSMFGIAGPSPYIWRIGAAKFERFDANTGLSSKNVTGQPTGSALANLQGSTSWRQNRLYMVDDILYINVDDVLERFVGTLAYNTSVSSTNFYAGVMWNLERDSMNSTDVHLYNYPYGNSTAVIMKNYTMPLQDLANLSFDYENNIIFHSSNGGYYTAGINANTGELMWNTKSEVYFEGQGTVINGVGVVGAEDTLKVYGFDLKTGRQIWESTAADYPWGSFRAYSAGAAYDKAYIMSYDGTIRAYSYDNGTVVWKYYDGTDVTGESPYGTYPFYNNPAIAGGIVFAATAEHTPTLPLKRGDRLYAIDDATGNLLWSIMGCNSQLAIADGVLLASDSYMPMMYGFAKGQTQTTVSTSTKIVSAGSLMLIEGTVSDLSPAQPNTPAISDESMGAWMEYLHMQQPKPTNATGVTVSLDTLDPNGNIVHIDTVKSDAAGTFSYAWATPDIAGKYTIIATLVATESYYTSLGETAAVLTETAPTVTPTATPTSVADTYFVPAVAGIIATIVLVGAVLALPLRKRSNI